jgi:hypothetical protein
MDQAVNRIYFQDTTVVSFPAQGALNQRRFEEGGLLRKKEKKDGRGMGTSRLLCPCWLRTRS